MGNGRSGIIPRGQVPNDKLRKGINFDSSLSLSHTHTHTQIKQTPSRKWSVVRSSSGLQGTAALGPAGRTLHRSEDEASSPHRCGMCALPPQRWQGPSRQETVTANPCYLHWEEKHSLVVSCAFQFSARLETGPRELWGCQEPVLTELSWSSVADRSEWPLSFIAARFQ